MYTHIYIDTLQISHIFYILYLSIKNISNYLYYIKKKKKNYSYAHINLVKPYFIYYFNNKAKNF